MFHFKCNRACKNRAYGLNYTMSFDDTYLNFEMQYLDSVSSVVKPNKLSTNLENFVAVPYWNKSYESQKFEKQSNFKSAHALFSQAWSQMQFKLPLDKVNIEIDGGRKQPFFVRGDTLIRRSKQPGPLFITKEGTGWTGPMFHAGIKSLMVDLKLDERCYNTHSFRIGAATSASLAKLPDAHIQTWQMEKQCI